MDLLKRFENAEFGQLSVIVKDGKEYMDGIHVATMLGYLNPRDAIVRHCTEAGVVFHDTGVVTGKKADGSDSIQYFKRIRRCVKSEKWMKPFMTSGNLQM